MKSVRATSVVVAGVTRTGRILILLVALLIAGCHSTPGGGSLSRFEFNEPHMGTMFTITLYARDEAAAKAGAQAAPAKLPAGPAGVVTR